MTIQQGLDVLAVERLVRRAPVEDRPGVYGRFAGVHLVAALERDDRAAGRVKGSSLPPRRLGPRAAVVERVLEGRQG